MTDTEEGKAALMAAALRQFQAVKRYREIRANAEWDAAVMGTLLMTSIKPPKDPLEPDSDASAKGLPIRRTD